MTLTSLYYAYNDQRVIQYGFTVVIDGHEAQHVSVTQATSGYRTGLFDLLIIETFSLSTKRHIVIFFFVHSK